MPTEKTNHQDLLAAIRKVPYLSRLLKLDKTGYHYEVEADVAVYGRNYHGKQVGPYFRLLEFSGSDDPPEDPVTRKGDWEDNKFFVLVEGRLKEEGSFVAEPGSKFGDMSLLAGIPQLATAAVPPGEKALLLEIQRPAIRLLRKLPGFSESLDKSYEVHGKKQALNELGIERDLADRLSEMSIYRVYSKGHLLFRKGEPMDRLYIIKSGWLRRGPEQDYDLLGAGTVLAAEALEKDHLRWSYAATVEGRTEALEVSIPRLRELYAGGHLPDWIRQSRTPPFRRQAEGIGLTAVTAQVLSTQERLIDTGVVDGTNVLVMDMDLCVRCGNCSLACHKVHGQTRLVRRGIQIVRLRSPKRASERSLLFPQVCLHCKDPECLTGCPTGAIRRLPEGQVDVNAGTCIGCGDCAVQCPYDAISMVPRPDSRAQTKHSIWGRIRPYVWPIRESVPALPEPKDELLAVKCNLCQDTPLNPEGSKRAAYSCEENCPTGALARVDPAAYFKETEQLKGALFLDKNHVLSRNVHKRGPAHIAIHTAGLMLLATAVWFIAGKIAAYGLSKPAFGRLNMEWITGIGGGAGIAGAMFYSIRRKIYTRRFGQLKYWVLAHCYVGALALVAIFFHVGTRTGGPLTTALTLSFDLVLVTGFIGIISYQAAPRLMTRIEGTPLLLDDLIERRRELLQELAEIRGSSPTPEAHDQLIRRFRSLRFLMKQYLVKGVVDRMIAAEKEKAGIRYESSVTNDTERTKAVEAAVTLRRVEALIYLHYVLKAWVVPHALSASLMVALMLLHIMQVIWF